MYIMEDVESWCIQDNLLTPPAFVNLIYEFVQTLIYQWTGYSIMKKKGLKVLMVVINLYNYQLTFKYSHNWCIYTVNVKSLSFSFTRIKQNKYSDVKHDTKQKN